MPDITIDKPKTALLIADFYRDMMTTTPHATDRKVVQKTQALQKAARDRIIGLLLGHRVPARLRRDQRSQQDVQSAEGFRPTCHQRPVAGNP